MTSKGPFNMGQGHRHFWYGSIGEAEWGCTRVESLSTKQLLIHLTIRRTIVQSQISLQGSSPLSKALQLSKCNLVSRELGTQSEKWGENWWICHSSFADFSPPSFPWPLWPSPDVSCLIHWASLSELSTLQSSTVKMEQPKEVPLCSPRSALGALLELGQLLPWLSIQHVKGDSSGACSSAVSFLLQPTPLIYCT